MISESSLGKFLLVTFTKASFFYENFMVYAMGFFQDNCI